MADRMGPHTNPIIRVCRTNPLAIIAHPTGRLSHRQRASGDGDGGDGGSRDALMV